MHIISLLLLLLASKPNFIQTICMLTNNDNNNFADSLFASFVTCIQAHYEYIKCCCISAIFEVPIHFTETILQSNIKRHIYIYIYTNINLIWIKWQGTTFSMFQKLQQYHILAAPCYKHSNSTESLYNL